MPLQATLAEPVDIEGVGLHSGQPARLRLLPAPAGHGRRFQRMDLPGQPEIPAHIDQVRDTFLATTLGQSPASVSTVEHLLAACVICGVDNLQVQVWGSELPVLDGSAAPFMDRFTSLTPQSAAPVLEILAPVEVRLGARAARILPSPELRLELAIDFEHPAIGRQSLSLGPQDFASVATARTFGFAEQIQALHQAGRALGGSLDNALVFDASGPVNAPRMADEPVRHKALDLLGDLALVGARLQGRVVSERPGHALTQALLTELMRRPECWRLNTP